MTCTTTRTAPRSRSFTSALTLLALASALPAFAQPPVQARPTTPPTAEAAAQKPAPEPPPPSKACPDCAARRADAEGLLTQTFYLRYATSASDINEIATAIRQILAREDKTFVVPEQNAIIIRGIPEDMALVQKVLDNLDRPRKSWRLTYTVTEMDGTTRIGAQHYVMNLVDAQQTTLQQNSRVPIGGGQHGEVMTNYTYENVGVTFDAKLNQEGNGARLLSSIELDSIADPSVNPVVIRDSKLKGTHLLASGKPLVLGSMDIPGSTRHLEIEVLMEPLP